MTMLLRISRGALGLALVSAAACGGGGGSSGPKGQPVEVTLARDAWGVPHVFADTDRAALYGLGWATAEDRLFQMLRSRLMVQGRVAEFFGPGSVPGQENVEHDLAVRQVGWWRQALRATAALDAETYGLLSAYAEGVSDYMASPGAQLHPLIAQHGIPLERWRPEDCVGVWLRFARHFSADGGEEIGRLRQWETLLESMTCDEAYNEMIAGAVCDEDAAVVQQAEVPGALQNAMAAYAAQHGLNGVGNCPIPLPGPKFSQAWAVSGERTVSGRAVLVGDPRGEVLWPSNFLEWSVEGATFSVRGIGVAGSPIVLSGSTDRLAWSPTALGMDQADLFALTTDSQCPAGQYWLDGQCLDYAVDELETVLVKGGPDPQVHYRETVWGPVVTPILEGVIPPEEFALKRVPLHDPTRDTAAGFFRMARAGDIDGFFAALEGWSWPPLNLVFADAGGRIGYAVVGDVPVRASGACPSELALAGVIPQDGSLSSSDWIELLPHGLQPHLLDPAAGAVYSANHMPIGTWYPIPIRFGTGGAGHTFRSRRLSELLAALPAITDAAEVAALRLDAVHPARRDLVELGLWLRDDQSVHVLSAEALSALLELEPWWSAGATMDGTDPGATAAWLMDLTFREESAGLPLVTAYGGGENGLNQFLEDTLAGIHAVPAVPPSPDAATYVDQVLAEAWTLASTLAGPTSAWASWFQDNVLTFDLEAWETLEQLPPPAGSPPSVLVGPVPCADGGTLSAVPEQGHTQVVEPGAGPLALSLTPPGTSEHAGPHALDQLPLWVGATLKPAPRSLAEVLAGGGVTTTLLTYTP